MRNPAATLNQRAYGIAILHLWLLSAVAAPSPVTAIRLTPGSLTFSSQVVGTSSESQAVELGNIGTASLTNLKLSASGDFSETNTCAGEIAANVSCTVNITFAPTAKGTRRGTLTVVGNGAASPRVVHLLGVGTQVKLSVDTLSFEGQPVHTSSIPKLVTLTNVGNTPLRIAAIRITPTVEVWRAPPDLSVSSSHRANGFAETNGCGSFLAQAASCTISVTFAPRRAGSSTAWLVINDDGGGSPQRVNLWGVGLR